MKGWNLKFYLEVIPECQELFEAFDSNARGLISFKTSHENSFNRHHYLKTV